MRNLHNRKSTSNASHAMGLSIIFLYLAGVTILAIGWVLNIVKLFDVGPMAGWTFFEVLRIIGIFLAPLGGLMGWF